MSRDTWSGRSPSQTMMQARSAIPRIRSDTEDVENIGAWMTTIVARICLNILRDRRSQTEAPIDAFLPEPIISTEAGGDPEHEASRRRRGDCVTGRPGGSEPGRAHRVRAPRHVRRAIRGDRRAPGAHASGDPAARQPRPAPSSRRGTAAGSRPRSSADGRRRLLRRCPRGRPRRADRRARSRRRGVLPHAQGVARAARRR